MQPQVEIKQLPFLPLALFRGSPSREITLYSKGKILRAGPGLSGLMQLPQAHPAGQLICSSQTLAKNATGANRRRFFVRL